MQMLFLVINFINPKRNAYYYSKSCSTIMINLVLLPFQNNAICMFAVYVHMFAIITFYYVLSTYGPAAVMSYT